MRLRRQRRPTAADTYVYQHGGATTTVVLRDGVWWLHRWSACRLHPVFINYRNSPDHVFLFALSCSSESSCRRVISRGRTGGYAQSVGKSLPVGDSLSPVAEQVDQWQPSGPEHFSIADPWRPYAHLVQPDIAQQTANSSTLTFTSIAQQLAQAAHGSLDYVRLLRHHAMHQQFILIIPLLLPHG